MYAVIKKNKLHISIAEFYQSSWYKKGWPISSGREKLEIDYGHLEIDIHKKGRKYLTGFAIDPRAFIVDYIKTRYKKDFPTPKCVVSVSIDSSEHHDLFSVDFLKARSFVINKMEKDLIFPQFVKKKGELKIQGFEVLSVFSMIKYLTKRFGFKVTTLVRQGETVYDLKSGKSWKIGRKKKS